MKKKIYLWKAWFCGPPQCRGLHKIKGPFSWTSLDYLFVFLFLFRFFIFWCGIGDIYIYSLLGLFQLYYIYKKRNQTGLYTSFFWPVPGFPKKGVGYIPIFFWYITIWTEEEWDDLMKNHPPEKVLKDAISLFYKDGHIRYWVLASLGHGIVWSTDFLSYMEGVPLPPIYHTTFLGGDLYIKLYTGTLKQGIRIRYVY